LPHRILDTYACFHYKSSYVVEKHGGACGEKRLVVEKLRISIRICAALQKLAQ
jgi:hypothetical protein